MMRASSKQLITYPGGYHEPHNDINYAQVTADISDWLDHQQIDH
jgi:alpha-beta hydrolase superfamily lysophospholipase